MFIETVPENGSALAHLIGGIAFERSLTESYSTIQEQGATGVSEAYRTFMEEMASPGSPCHEIARTYIVQVFGGRCGIQQMEAALRGYMAEAEERFVIRASEIQLDRLEMQLADVAEFATADWSDAAAIFRR